MKLGTKDYKVKKLKLKELATFNVLDKKFKDTLSTFLESNMEDTSPLQQALNDLCSFVIEGYDNTIDVGELELSEVMNLSVNFILPPSAQKK